MKVVSVREMRTLDQRTIEEHGTPGAVLMDLAGKGVADAARSLAERYNFRRARVLLLAGKGNNGGDAFVAARYLHRAGWEVELWLVAQREDLRGDALRHLDLLLEDGITLQEKTSFEEWKSSPRDGREWDLVIDGLLGTGIKGAARGLSASAIEFVNCISASTLVVAIDIPSGLDADNGAAPGPVVRADMTVTMGLPKQGLLRQEGLEYLGTLEIVDIGIPDIYLEEVAGEQKIDFISAREVTESLSRRRCDAHKGDYGRLLMLGGARGFSGAIRLAALGALRSGAGLVSARVPSETEAIVASGTPELMVNSLAKPEDLADGAVSALGDLEQFDALLIGPGLGQSKWSRNLVEEVLERSKVPVVLDADALNCLQGRIDDLADAEFPIVLTPHPGECARLLGKSVSDIQADRRGAARKAARRSGSLVVLKGAGTLVATPTGELSVNMTGNPGLATGGSGDFLAGILVSLLGQGLQPCIAARTSVWLHGRAGDFVAAHRTQRGLIPSDLASELSAVMRSLILR